MNRPFLNVVIFTLVFVGSVVWLCGLLSRISGETASVGTIAGISPEAGAGEELWTGLSLLSHQFSLKQVLKIR